MDQTTWAWCTTHLKVWSHSQVAPTRPAKSRRSPKAWSTHLSVQMQLTSNSLKTTLARPPLIQLKLNSYSSNNNPSRARVPLKKKKHLKMETALILTLNRKMNKLGKIKKINPRIKNRNSWITWLLCILILCKCFMAAKEVILYHLACHLDSNRECHTHHSILSQVCLSMELSLARCILLVTLQEREEPVNSRLDILIAVVLQCSQATKTNLFCQSHQIIWRTSNYLERNQCSPHMQETLQKVADQIKDYKEPDLIQIKLLRIIFYKPPQNVLRILALSPTKMERLAKTRQRRSTFQCTKDLALPRTPPSASRHRLKCLNSITTSPWWLIILDLLLLNNCLAPIRKIRMYPKRKRQSVKNLN